MRSWWHRVRGHQVFHSVLVYKPRTLTGEVRLGEVAFKAAVCINCKTAWRI